MISNADYNCSTFSDYMSQYGSKGCTVWGPMTTAIHLAANGGSWTGTFTCTQPKCYESTDDCNMTYTIATNVTSTTGNDVGPITQTFSSTKPGYVNGVHGVYTLSGSSQHYHSKIEGHDVTITQDLVPADQGNNPPVTDINGHPLKILYDGGANTITLTNNDPNIDVWIEGLQIVRGYGMDVLTNDMANPSPCQPDNIPSGSNDFYLRQDYPCTYETCGEVSFTAYLANDDYYSISGIAGKGTVLYPNTTYSWSWPNPAVNCHYQGTNYNDYVGPFHCLFNFNNVELCDNNGNTNVQASTDDVPIAISLDNVHWKTFYHCMDAYTVALGLDLATDSYLSQYYNDSPGASNTLYLKILGNPGVNLLLHDGLVGNVNLYRWYKTASLCQTITVQQNPGGTISPGTTSVYYGGDKSFTITADPTYHIANVFPTNSQLGSQVSPYTYTFHVVTSPQTLLAYFEPGGLCYGSITCSPSDAGSISCSPNPPSCTSDTVFTANETADYKFYYWQAGSGNMWNLFDNPLTLNISGIDEFVAHFAPATYVTASVNDASRGSISPSGTYKAMQGSNPLFIATPNVGSIVDHFIVDGNYVAGGSGAQYYWYDPIGSGTHAITAYFAAQPTLVINAIDQYWGWNPMYPNVYVDGNLQEWDFFSGTITLGYLSAGSHTVTVDDPAWDTAWNIYTNFQCMVDGDSNYYGNGDYVPVSTVTYLTIYYQY